MDTMNDRLMLRPTEAADSLGVSRSKCYELIAKGEEVYALAGGEPAGKLGDAITSAAAAASSAMSSGLRLNVG